jgi:hypothetical protein
MRDIDRVPEFGLSGKSAPIAVSAGFVNRFTDGPMQPRVGIGRYYGNEPTGDRHA